MSNKKGKSAPPKLHKFMHPRNPYRTPPSFKKLAQNYVGFRAHCTYELDGKVRLNFKDPLALRELTTCLLDQDFGLKVNIPEGRLVPTLPLRFNYLLWIEDLLNLSGCRNIQKDLTIGLDVGCGATCIYPLLAAKQNGWYMLATEADKINYDCSVSNVNANNLESHIVIQKVEQDVILKGVLESEETVNDIMMFRNHQNSIESGSVAGMQTELSNVSHRNAGDGYLLDFMMCNPPFFGSLEETDSMNKSRKDRGEPRSVATGAVQETVTEGGEVSFICQMIDESFLFREKVRIFSSMIGTKAHVKEVKDKLKSVSPAHIAAVEFCQGRTMRWGVAWTFNPSMHLENVMSKKQMDSAKPLVLMLSRSLMTVYTVPAAWAMINKWLHKLKINVQVFKNTKYFVGANVKAYKPTWLHQRRKRENRKERQAEEKWFAIFGAPKILSDSGEEFQNEKVRRMAERWIKVMATASESPWSNGISEKMVDIKKAKDDEEVVCIWKNLSVPNLLGEQSSSPARREKVMEESIVKDTLNEVHTAREVFIKNESCNKIRIALNRNVREHKFEEAVVGDQVFCDEIQREVYLKPPSEDGWSGLWKLKKTVYRLKHAAKAWYCKVVKVVEELKGESRRLEPNIFFWRKDSKLNAIRETIELGEIKEVRWIKGKCQRADVLTKAGVSGKIRNYIEESELESTLDIHTVSENSEAMKNEEIEEVEELDSKFSKAKKTQNSMGRSLTFNPSMHLENVMSKKQMDSAKPLVLMLSQSLMTVYTVPAAWAMINKWLHKLKINVQVFKNTKYFVGANVKAYKPTWLHQRRKRREQKRKASRGKESEKAESELESTLDIHTVSENSEAMESVGMEVDDNVSLKRAYTGDTEDEEVKSQDGIKRQKVAISSVMKVQGNLHVIACETAVSTPHQNEEIEEVEELDSKFSKAKKTQNSVCTENDGNQNSSVQGSSGGLECILKAKLQLKQCGALISLEAFYLKGSAGKDGLNQVLQYMKNQLTKA
ncbi:uncharacterized protein [Macrobrachium rosenbergii]|uniref:uncharacterized protein n=1 Tax=Macrobrachium rosenbergii TaxID=79674 RepID=UPI0034D73355